VLLDRKGELLTVEIELQVRDGELPGLLQALKYRIMIECSEGRKPGSASTFLVAHEISKSMQRLCRKYKVTPVTIPKSALSGRAR
jgi:hypothetical protein